MLSGFWPAAGQGASPSPSARLLQAVLMCAQKMGERAD